MRYPLDMVMDKTAKDLKEVTLKFMEERMISPTYMDYILYKVMDEIHREKNNNYAELYIGLSNIKEDLEIKLKEKEPKEEEIVEEDKNG